ncbi:MAG TPA: phosphate ABC transporter permease PstA [Armatimonadota bacterium]|jgi:phosphate transport system permease protein
MVDTQETITSPRSIRRGKPRIGESIAVALTAVATLCIVAPVTAIVWILIARGGRALTWEFLTAMPRDHMTAGGIFPAIMGTVYLVAGTVIIALPVGILSAIYLSEYAKQGPLTRIIRLAIVNLAGVPSIVYGLFGYGVFVLLLKFQVSILSGACTLALLTLPLIITATEESLRTVPASFREASVGLGATRFQTVWRIVLPGALPGILTGAILGVGRAAGETAPILFTAAVFYQKGLPHSLSSPIMALPYHLYIIATQVPDAPQSIQWGTALVLLLLVLFTNLGAIIIRSRLRAKRNW